MSTVIDVQVDPTSIAKAVALVDESQAAIDTALVHLNDLESLIHDHLTGLADEYVKTSLLNVARLVEANLRKAQL